MNCTYTAQGFLACQNVNVQKFTGQENVREGFAPAQQVAMPSDVKGNLLQACKKCSVVSGSCNSKKECVIKCDCDYCDGSVKKTQVGVQTPKSKLVSTKPGTTINWCGNSSAFGAVEKCTSDQLAKLSCLNLSS